MLKDEYEAALKKLNSLKERFPEKVTELQEHRPPLPGRPAAAGGTIGSALQGAS